MTIQVHHSDHTLEYIATLCSADLINHILHKNLKQNYDKTIQVSHMTGDLNFCTTAFTWQYCTLFAMVHCTEMLK